MHYFLFHDFSRKIGQNQKSTSWRIRITDIQSGNIGGLAGRNQSLPFSLWMRCDSRVNAIFLCGSFGEHPLPSITITIVVI